MNLHDGRKLSSSRKGSRKSEEDLDSPFDSNDDEPEKKVNFIDKFIL